MYIFNSSTWEGEAGGGLCEFNAGLNYNSEFSKATELFPTLPPIPRKKGLFKLQNQGWVKVRQE